MAENEMDAGFRPMTGVNGAEDETVDVVGVSSWVNPGIAADNFFIPRPLVESPTADEPDTATPARDDVPDNVEEVGLDRAPASEKDVVDVVVVIDDFTGAMVLDVVGLSAVASLLWI
jgi:hypothetical protein